MSFYSVYIPQKINQDTGGNPANTCVFREKNEALKVLKKHKDARLKLFANKDDAAKYAETGYEECLSTKYPDNKSCSPLNLEKAAFRAPTRQELIVFRKLIEAGKLNEVKQKIWENPHYLISSGDTPTSLKEGYRYNAMHICALGKHAHVAALILETVSNIEYIELLYGKKKFKSQKVCAEASRIILDYFLNMPEKGRYETPLHLAAKIGAVEMVELLTSYPQCKMTPNSDGLLPKDIICSRSPNPEAYEKILSLLEERFYVPVIRSANNTVPPTIGQPFSVNSPPKLNSDPLSPEVEIRAVAGPMSKEKAESFCRRWKTPPRMTNSPFLSPGQLRSSTPTKLTPKNDNIARTPYRKCLFSIRSKEDGSNHSNNSDSSKTNELVEDNNNGNSENGLDTVLMTPCNKKKYTSYRENMNASPFIMDLNDSLSDSPGFAERNLKLIDTEKGFEIIGRELAKEHYVEWKEYWDFLDIFIDIASEQGLTKLENYLSEREKSATKVTKSKECKELMDDLCNAFDKLQLHNSERMNFDECDGDRRANNKAVANNVPQLTMPYTCVEKSLQVFAKRMTKNLLYNIDSIVSINDAFLSELKRLKSLIVSFMDDPRFLNVNFAKVHSRFSYQIVSYLDDAQRTGKTSKAKIQSCLQQMWASPGERREHLQCVCNKMLSYMDADRVIEQPENVKTEEMCIEIWRQESYCDCKWDSVLNRKESRRSRKNRPVTTVDFSDHNKPGENPQTQPGTLQDSSENEDVFWSDIGSDDDADECFMTPPESQSALSFSSIDDNDYHLFLLGNEPTKRDVDVLNAIFNIQISHDTYPHIYNWKTALLRYSVGEMEQFPSPLCVAKSSSFSSSNQLPAPRILFNSPILKSKTMNSVRKDISCSLSDANENSRDGYFEDEFV